MSRSTKIRKTAVKSRTRVTKKVSRGEPRKRFYVGLPHDFPNAPAELIVAVPGTVVDDGTYYGIAGPFRSKRGAMFFRDHGHQLRPELRPHSYAEVERLAKTFMKPIDARRSHEEAIRAQRDRLRTAGFLDEAEKETSDSHEDARLGDVPTTSPWDELAGLTERLNGLGIQHAETPRTNVLVFMQDRQEHVVAAVLDIAPNMLVGNHILPDHLTEAVGTVVQFIAHAQDGLEPPICVLVLPDLTDMECAYTKFFNDADTLEMHVEPRPDAFQAEPQPLPHFPVPYNPFIQ